MSYIVRQVRVSDLSSRRKRQLPCFSRKRIVFLVPNECSNAWGAANIPQDQSYVNWMLHMSIYVFCGSLVGLALGEWAGVNNLSIRLLWAGVAIIIAAANLVGLGMAS